MQQREVTGWVGWVVFGAFIMIMIGLFDIIGGLVAIIDDDWRVGASGKVFVFDDTAWGWTTLIIGVIVLLAAFAVLRGAVWGRLIAVVMATLNAIAHLSLVRAFPVWSLIVIFLNVFVIYALIVHGDELREAR